MVSKAMSGVKSPVLPTKEETDRSKNQKGGEERKTKGKKRKGRAERKEQSNEIWKMNSILNGNNEKVFFIIKLYEKKKILYILI